jgi:hypothetical protein
VAHELFGQNNRRQQLRRTSASMSQSFDGGQQDFVANPGVVVHQAKHRAGRLALYFDEGWYCVDLAEVERPEFKPVLPTPHTAWRGSSPSHRGAAMTL